MVNTCLVLSLLFKALKLDICQGLLGSEAALWVIFLL